MSENPPVPEAGSQAAQRILNGKFVHNGLWPRYIDGKKIKSHFTNKDVGLLDALCGGLNNVHLNVFSMKR